MAGAQSEAVAWRPDAGEPSPWTAGQKVVALLAALAFLIDGMANQVLGVAMPAIARDWGVGKAAFATAVALGLVGMAVGAVGGGAVGDRIGRRPSMIAGLVLVGLSTSAIAVAPSVTVLDALRLAAGLGLGALIANGSALVAEVTPANRRSIAVTCSMMFIIVGAILIGLVAAWILPKLGWRALVGGIGGAALIIAALFALTLAESPHHAERRRSGATGGAGLPLVALFSTDFWATTVALWAGLFFCMLGHFSLLSWLPSMLTSRGFSLASASMAVSVYNCGGLVSAIVAGFAIMAWGYRRVMVVGAVVAAALVAGLAFGAWSQSTALPLMAGLAVTGLFFGVTQNGLYALAAHVYPPLMKGTGVGAMSAVGRLGGVVSAYTGVISFDLAGSRGYFSLIAAAALLTGLSAATLRERGEDAA